MIRPWTNILTLNYHQNSCMQIGQQVDVAWQCGERDSPHVLAGTPPDQQSDSKESYNNQMHRVYVHLHIHVNIMYVSLRPAR